MKKIFILAIFVLFFSQASYCEDMPLYDNYKEIHKLDHSGFMQAEKGGKKYIFYYKMGTVENKPVISSDEYESFRFEDEFMIITKNGKMGLYYTNKKLCDTIYDSIVKVNPDENFKYYFLAKQKKSYTVFNENGKIEDENYTRADVKYNFIVVQKGGKYGIINMRNKKTLPLLYDEITVKEAGKNNSCVITNKKGTKHAYNGNLDLITDKNIDNIEPVLLNNGAGEKYLGAYIITVNNKKNVYMSKEEGKYLPLFAEFYDDIEVKVENKPESFNKINAFIVTKNNKQGVYKRNEQNNYDLVIPIQYENIDSEYWFYDYEIWYLTGNKKTGGYRFINNSLVNIIPQEYDNISHLDFSINDTAFYFIVEKNKKYGLYDIKKGKIFIPVEYDKIEKGADVAAFIGTLIVTKDGKKGVYNIWDDRFDYKLGYENGYKYNKKSVPAEFDNIEVVHNGFIVTKDGKKGFFHIDKGKIIDTKYNNITLSSSQNKLRTDFDLVEKTIDKNNFEKYIAGEKRLLKILDDTIFCPFKGLH